MLSLDKPFIFPNRFSGIDSKSLLITELKVAGMKEGYCLVHRSTKSKKQMENDGNFSSYVSLYCVHAVPFRKRKTMLKRLCKTRYCMDSDHKCTFHFNIALLKSSGRWQLMNCKGKSKLVCRNHSGHLKMNSSHLDCSTKFLSPEEIALAKNCAQIHMNCTMTSELLSVRNYLGLNNQWSRHQIYYMENRMKTLTSNSSSAESLVNSIGDRTDVNYLYITFKPSEGLMILTGKH